MHVLERWPIILRYNSVQQQHELIHYIDFQGTSDQTNAQKIMYKSVIIFANVTIRWTATDIFHDDFVAFSMHLLGSFTSSK